MVAQPHFIKLLDRHGQYACAVNIAALQFISADGDSTLLDYTDGTTERVDNGYEEVMEQVLRQVPGFGFPRVKQQG
jgi:hypothetical protein